MASITETATVTGVAHILVFPYPALGHMIPLLDLTHHLLTSRDGTLTITVVITPANLPLLQPLLSCHPPSSISALILPFPPHPSILPGCENLRNMPPGSLIPLTSTLRRLREPLHEWFISHPSPPSSIVSDMFLGWTHELAVQLGIKRFVFSPSGAFALSVMHALWNHLPIPTTTKDGSFDENAVVWLKDIPGEARFPWYQLSTLYRAYASGNSDSQFLRNEFLNNLDSWGLIVNTFNGLEHAHLKSTMGHDRVWAVGPLFPRDTGASRSGSDEDQILSWLDKCLDDEVVYVCFGSEAMLTNEQMEVLALGLEKSKVRFIWKIKEHNDGHVGGERFEKLPRGFEDHVDGRGLVIRGWAPQVLILRHRAVGAFLTHCGWNSVLEGLSYGVMMLPWPLGADQFPNATLIVDQLKVGVMVGQGTRSLPDPDYLARVLDGLVSGAYTGHRSRALELKRMASEATSEGGSSWMGLNSLVQHLAKLPNPVLNRARIQQTKEEQDAALEAKN